MSVGSLNEGISGNEDMGWLRLVGSLQLQVSFAEDRLFCRAEYSLFYRAEYRLFCRAIFVKETYNLKEPTPRGHPIIAEMHQCVL